MTHWFDPLTDLCMCCGLAAQTFVQDGCRPFDCPDNDHRAYLLARHRLEAIVGVMLGDSGETRH